jgi:hypothetical protein
MPMGQKVLLPRRKVLDQKGSVYSFFIVRGMTCIGKRGGLSLKCLEARSRTFPVVQDVLLEEHPSHLQLHSAL